MVYLRFLAALLPEQRRLAQTPAGLPFRQMSVSLQQQFLALPFGNSGAGISPETLPGARLRIEFSLPGAFEWVPADEWEKFSLRRVRAATPELALAAARRIDPAVTPAELLPMVAALQLEYSLGPTADGWEQFWVYAPNWSSSGRRQADHARLTAADRPAPASETGASPAPDATPVAAGP